MQPASDIPTALEKIAAILRQANYSKHAIDIEALRKSALSSDNRELAHFQSEITQNKWYWLGMGTIADISLSDRELHGQFIRAYHELAIACEANGFGSIYSQDVATIFGRWIQDGVV